MSDDEKLDLRNLPPVKHPVPSPERLSQTLLGHADRCPRAAYLYLRHHGGAPSHAMNRGTLFHTFAERLAIDLMRRGERSLVAVQPGEAWGEVETEVATITEAMVAGIMDEQPELVVSAADADAVRRMAYHLGLAWDVDPTFIAGVEQKFVLDLPSGWVVSGKVDLLSLPTAYEAQVDDYKTSLHVPTQEEFEDSFQTPLYAALVAFGHPVDKVECPICGGSGQVPFDPGGSLHDGPAMVPLVKCDRCSGRGHVEERRDPIGQHISRFVGRQLYPRFLRDDGTLERRETAWSRTDLNDFLQDVDRTARRISHGLLTGRWPAIPGSWCSMCPSEPECPLPAYLRDWQGAVQSREQAEAVLAWTERMGDRVRKVKADVKEFAKGLPSGLVRVGEGDQAYELTVTQSKSLRRKGRSTDWEGFEQAIERAVRGEEPLDLEFWIRPTASTNFKKVKLDAEQLAAFADNNEGVSDGR
jgi:hypothetical protein